VRKEEGLRGGEKGAGRGIWGGGEFGWSRQGGKGNQMERIPRGREGFLPTETPKLCLERGEKRFWEGGGEARRLEGKERKFPLPNAGLCEQKKKNPETYGRKEKKKSFRRGEGGKRRDVHFKGKGPEGPVL